MSFKVIFFARYTVEDIFIVGKNISIWQKMGGGAQKLESLRL